MTLRCIYASTSGNVESTVEYVAEWVRAKGHEVTLYRAEKTPFSVINEHDRFIIASSTWEHGVLNPFFNKLATEMKTNSLVGKKASFIGLGDTRYEPVLFCAAIDTLKDVWLKSGGEVIATPLKINGEPFHQFDSLVTPWMEHWWQEFERV